MCQTAHGADSQKQENSKSTEHTLEKHMLVQEYANETMKNNQLGDQSKDIGPKINSILRDLANQCPTFESESEIKTFMNKVYEVDQAYISNLDKLRNNPMSKPKGYFITYNGKQLFIDHHVLALLGSPVIFPRDMKRSYPIEITLKESKDHDHDPNYRECKYQITIKQPAYFGEDRQSHRFGSFRVNRITMSLYKN